ncbi:hypothetical protein ACFY5F_38315 [Streptomyces sp. NPDC013161]|uniref:hypothetical protein n=1 Tax=Streptomyces sp. NPDC013161 TaxID=3364862 RepID=UPI00369B6D29
MDIRGIDPRDAKWEQDHARYRVYFWDVGAVTDGGDLGLVRLAGVLGDPFAAEA